MTSLLRLLIVWIACATPALAAPTRYTLETAGSTVEFVYTLNAADQRGSMPVGKADLVIDPDNLAASQIDVTLDVTATRTGFIFATEALKGRSVLNVAQFPTVTFTSTSIKLGPSGRLSNGATVTGRVTVRGVTKPITLRADIYRPRGSAPDDLSRLEVHLTGQIRRSTFGATGYADLVDDTVVLDIRAKIRSIQ